MSVIEHQRSKRMEELRQQKFGTDVVLECNEGPIHAHRLILMSSCDYFQKMFTTNLVEKQTGRVSFKHTSSKVIEVIVRYLYTLDLEPLHQDETFLKELITTCHMMDITELLLHAGDAITYHFNIGSFVDLWSFAIQFNFEKNEKITAFIIKHLAKVSKYVNIRNLTVQEMECLITSVDSKTLCKERVECIFQWAVGDDRNGEATRLLEKINLSCVDFTSFLQALQVCREYKTDKTAEAIMIDEILKRFNPVLTNQSEACHHCNIPGSIPKSKGLTVGPVLFGNHPLTGFKGLTGFK